MLEIVQDQEKDEKYGLTNDNDYHYTVFDNHYQRNIYIFGGIGFEKGSIGIIYYFYIGAVSVLL